MENKAPVNVKLEKPTIEIEGWDEDARRWKTINSDVNGHPDFYPLTIKAAYVIGVIHTICESVSILLKDPQVKLITYLPAYGVFASGIELLGRCVNGNLSTRENTKDLASGFKWLAASYFESYKNSYKTVPDVAGLIQTNKYMYTISSLVALRHFAAHGQATSRKIANTNYYTFGYIDYEILAQFPPLLANGLELYWRELQSSDALCNNLAKANVIALRKFPVFLSLSLFEKNSEGVYQSVSEIFRKFDWTV